MQTKMKLEPSETSLREKAKGKTHTEVLRSSCLELVAVAFCGVLRFLIKLCGTVKLI